MTRPTQPAEVSPIVTDAVPAATVILLRDAPGGAVDTAAGIETLMLRRNSKLTFAGGAWVFPGGRVDPEDLDPDHPEDEIATARRAAAREAAEEAGLRLDPAAFVVLSRWCPPPQAPRRFNTWFFVAAAPVAEVVIDGGEIHDHAWISPAEALRRRRSGEVELIPPTWVTLLGLSTFSSVAEALATVAGREPDVFVTRMVKGGDGRQALLWGGDAGYDVGDMDAAGSRHRLWMHEPDDWRYERDFDRPTP